jgi:hypothetical protein
VSGLIKKQTFLLHGILLLAAFWAKSATDCLVLPSVLFGFIWSWRLLHNTCQVNNLTVTAPIGRWFDAFFACLKRLKKDGGFLLVSDNNTFDPNVSIVVRGLSHRQ